MYRTVGYRSSFGGDPLRQHIGLGAAQRVDKLTVTRPSSHTMQEFRDVAADATYHLREGEGWSAWPCPLRVAGKER